MKRRFIFKTCSLFTAVLFLLNCTDPVTPEFQYRDGLIYMDARISTSPGSSYALIYKSNTDLSLLRNIFQPGATVAFRNLDTNEAIPLSEVGFTYLPPEGFQANPGETWQLEVILEDGREYRSLPEKVLAPVPIQEIKVSYSRELTYREEYEGFIPGHAISVDFTDPGESTNYYLWGYRSFERPPYCQICFVSIFRDGECIRDPRYPDRYYTYYCETNDCYQIRYNEEVQILSDEFVNGMPVNDLMVAQIPLYTRENILVEVQQLSVSPKAYDYYKVIKDIVDNNTGFNAPTPAALIGNLRSLGNEEEFVLGRFTAFGSTTQTIFIDRSNIEELALEDQRRQNLESELGPEEDVTSVPCRETRFQTSNIPDGWMD